MNKSTLAALALGCMLSAQAVWAVAADPIWQWEHPAVMANPDAFYSGQISGISDGSSTLPFSRSDFSGSQGTVSQPPVLLYAGLDIEFDIVNVDTWINKTVNGETCPASSTFSVYATPVTLCDSGTANDIQGFHVSAEDGSGANDGQFRPRLQVYTNGSWKYVTAASNCGRLELKRFCKDNPAP